MIDIYSPLIFMALIIMILLLRNRMQRAVQPLRLEMADIGERLLADSTLPPKAKAHVRFFLNSAFGARGFMIFSIVALPFVAIYFALFPKSLDTTAAKMGIHNSELRGQFWYISKIHDRIMLAAHPIMFTILMIEFAIMMPIILLGIALSKSSPMGAADRDVMMTILEEKMPRRLAA